MALAGVAAAGLGQAGDEHDRMETAGVAMTDPTPAVRPDLLARLRALSTQIDNVNRAEQVENLLISTDILTAWAEELLALVREGEQQPEPRIFGVDWASGKDWTAVSEVESRVSAGYEKKAAGESVEQSASPLCNPSLDSTARTPSPRERAKRAMDGLTFTTGGVNWWQQLENQIADQIADAEDAVDAMNALAAPPLVSPPQPSEERPMFWQHLKQQFNEAHQALESVNNRLFTGKQNITIGLRERIERISETIVKLPDPPVSAPQPWQPIATAPKDRTNVLVFYPSEAIVACAWWSASDLLTGPQPTHWMPLPDPPVSAPSEKGEK